MMLPPGTSVADIRDVGSPSPIADGRARVLLEAASWLGTPFLHQRAVKGLGIDCVLSLCEIFHAVGLIPRLDPRPYARGPFVRDDRYLRWMAPYVVPRQGPAQPADIALFWVPPRNMPAQSAIVKAWPTLYLADVNEGFIETSAERDWIAGRLHSVWTVKGLA